MGGWNNKELGRQYEKMSSMHAEEMAKRIAAELRASRLEDALRRVVRDINDYEEANKLSPNPGRSECWDSVAHAKAILAAA